MPAARHRLSLSRLAALGAHRSRVVLAALPARRLALGRRLVPRRQPVLEAAGLDRRRRIILRMIVKKKRGEEEEEEEREEEEREEEKGTCKIDGLLSFVIVVIYLAAGEALLVAARLYRDARENF